MFGYLPFGTNPFADNGTAAGPVTHTTSGALTGQIGSVVGTATRLDPPLPTGQVIVNNNNTTVTNLGGSVYQIEKTGGTNGARDAGAVSSVGVTGNFILRIKPVTTGTATTTYQYGAGVNDDPLTDDSFGGISNLLFWMQAASAWAVFENGVDQAENSSHGTYGWIWRNGSTLGYGSGNTLANAQASPDRVTSSTGTVYFDSTLYGAGDKMEVLFYTVPTVDHTTTGVLTGQGSTVAGTSVHNIPHPSSGALTGQIGSVAGTAARTREHATSGALIGPGSTVAGTSVHNIPHPTSGVLVGQIGSVVGAATRFRAHATSGALTGQIGSVVGTAAHIAVHATSGALVGQLGSVTGTAARFRAFSTSGVLTGQIGSVVGTAARFRAFATSGVLTGQIGSIVGTAARSSGATSHATSGDLIGQGSLVVGSSTRFRVFSTSGSLVGQSSTVVGTAARFRAFTVSGDLVGQSSTIIGVAQRIVAPITHTTVGNIIGSGSVLSADAFRSTMIIVIPPVHRGTPINAYKQFKTLRDFRKPKW